MRFLLDTNILIPLEQSQQPLVASLANFVRLSNENGHQLIYHPATEDDIRRDTNEVRRLQTLERLRQYSRLDQRPSCPWNDGTTSPNDIADNEILYALYCEAAHALVTEDHGIHRKAKEKGLGDRVYYIQTADDWLRRLHEHVPVQLPNIEEVNLYSLVPLLSSEFFDSLRVGYAAFDDWFRAKARNGLKAWVVRPIIFEPYKLNYLSLELIRKLLKSNDELYIQVTITHKDDSLEPNNLASLKNLFRKNLKTTALEDAVIKLLKSLTPEQLSELYIIINLGRNAQKYDRRKMREYILRGISQTAHLDTRYYLNLVSSRNDYIRKGLSKLDIKV